MTSRVWVGTLALCLGGGLSGLVAQETVWRPVLRPPAAAAGPPAPGASLGRPIPVTRASAPESDPPPTSRAAADSGIVPASYQVPGLAGRAAPPAYRTSPPETPPRPGEVIAASGPVAREQPDELTGDLFATERSHPAGLPRLNPPGQIAPVANWTLPFPVTPPLPGPPLPGEGALGANLPPPRFYLTGEYLLWWTKHDRVPPLVTTGDPAQQRLAGALPNPDTVVLFGGSLDRDPHSGGRFFAGYWLDDCGGKALEVGGFFLGPRSKDFAASSATFPVLTRPFFDLNRNMENTEQVAFPNRSTGSVSVHAPSNLWGLESNFKCNWCCGCDYRINLLAGVRYLNLGESVRVVETSQFLAGAGAPFAGSTVTNMDEFSTRNQFYGGQVGAEARWLRGPWSVDVRGKLALGVTHEEITINGSQRFTNFGGTPDPRPGGLLAVGSNIGHFNRDSFSVVPEVGINLGYSLTEHLRAYVGYNFLYWSSVVRPGDQIDRVVDSALIPNFNVPAVAATGQNRPAVPFKETDYWAHGLVIGLEFTY